jgi:ABC-type multidrug transport system fused ATPase/permease subunit
LRDNITLRDPLFTDKDVDEAVKISGLESVVNKLPDGLDTRLGMKGRSLSGGELQRLAIARALVRNPSVLVLDEATNHLDANACAAFGKLLRRLAKDRIVLLVAHDKEIINLCDEKIVCKSSRVL